MTHVGGPSRPRDGLVTTPEPSAMPKLVSLTTAAVLTLASAAACSAPGGDPSTSSGTAQSRAAFASAEATLVELEWDGEVVADWSGGAPDAIANQMLYTVGALNEFESVGQLEKLEITNRIVSPVPGGGGQHLVTYHAKLPVAWNKRRATPSTFALKLPRLGYWSSLVNFTAAYGATCVDASAHGVDAGSMWYYYRVLRPGCVIAPGDALEVTATVAPSLGNTTGKYPEYHRIWQDDLLKAVIIVGKYEEGATSFSDPGLEGYARFVDHVRQKLTRAATGPLTTTPPGLPTHPGVAYPDVTLEASLPTGKTVRVHFLLVDNVRTQGAAFDARYASLTSDADFIGYSGHAGLGANVRALLDKGSWAAGQHLLFFMNGCDTFAYVDGRLRASRAALNTDDPAGTKYLDMVTNAMPSYADAYSSEPVLLDALIDWQTPQTFADIFRNIDYRQVVAVTGEEDNEFVPGTPIGTVPSTGPDAGADAGPVVPDAGDAPDASP
ncbi:MAG TPA: hypothetical protein PLR99_14530, partial [Polyangiaceae bacterium]|nr:hypothetical protein [Polyangiaceae bacterium]